MERALLIQIQARGDSSVHETTQRLLADVRAVVPAGKWELQENPVEQWSNITIRSIDLADVWEALHSRVIGDQKFAQDLGLRWIVVCEGDDGWNDYKTLAHFDPKVALDSLPFNRE